MALNPFLWYLLIDWSVNQKGGAMSPRTKEQNEKIRRTRRREILDAAHQVFAERGFHDTRMSDIAHVAGVSQGTLYHYFASKDDLFLALCFTWADLMEAGIRGLFAEDESPSASEKTSAADKMSAMSHLAMAFFRTDEELAPVLVEFWAYALRNPKATERFRALFETMQHSYVTILEDGIASGEFKSIDVQTLSVLPFVVLDGAMLLASVLGRDTVDPGLVIEKTQQLVFDGLLAEPGGGES
jgi:AcrR family transcriptional regulator